MKFDILHTFISPVTGRVLCPKDYVLLGDKFGVATPSPILIDLRLDFNNLRQHYNILRDASFVIGFPNSELENAQVLQKLDNGFMFNDEGIVEIKTTIDATQYLTLTHKKVWIGDENNKPSEQQRIEIDNLPSFFTVNPLSLGGAYNLWTGSANPLKLGEPTTTLAIQRCNLPNLTVGKFWIGKAVSPTEDPLNFGSNRPVELDKLPAENMADLTKRHFWVGDDNNRPQITGLTYKNLIIGTESNELGFREKIYPENQVDLTFKKIRRGDATNRPVESDDLTVAENKITQIEQTIADIQTEIGEIQAALTALQTEIAAIQAEITVIQGQITALEAAVAVLQGQILVIQGQIVAINQRIDNLKLNNIPADGDVSFYNFKLINLADPVNQTDGVNLRTLTTYINNVPTTVDLTGDVTGSGNTGTPIPTTLQLTLDQIKIAQNTVNLNDQKIINLKSDEVEQKDALNAKFLWDLMHDQVEVVWI